MTCDLQSDGCLAFVLTWIISDTANHLSFCQSAALALKPRLRRLESLGLCWKSVWVVLVTALQGALHGTLDPIFAAGCRWQISEKVQRLDQKSVLTRYVSPFLLGDREHLNHQA